MEKSVQELAEFLKGKVEHDNPELRITGVNGLVEAGPKDISFAVPPHVEHCHLSKAGVMVLSPEDPELDGRPVIRVANPRAAFAAAPAGLPGHRLGLHAASVSEGSNRSSGPSESRKWRS